MNLLTLLFQRILRCLVLRYVDNAVHIEANLLAVGGPVLVAKAVRVPAIVLGVEGVIARADRSLLDFMATAGVLNLMHCQISMIHCCHKIICPFPMGCSLPDRTNLLHLDRNIPRNQCPSFHSLQILCRPPGM